jgi:hypothetical protein
MHPEITAMAAAEHVRDLRADAARRVGSSPGRQRATRRTTAGDGKRRTPLRNQTGWALVSLGLRIVASGSR